MIILHQWEPIFPALKADSADVPSNGEGSDLSVKLECMWS